MTRLVKSSSVNGKSRQLVACFEEREGLERILTAVDEEMYYALICISGAEEEDLCGIIAAMECQQTSAPNLYKA